MFTLTQAAADQIQESVRRSGAADLALRVAASRQIDGSLRFGMGFDEPREGDLPLQMRGIDIVIGKPSQALLSDTLLDFVEIEPDRFGFVFVEQPPAAAGGCGGRAGGCSSCAGGAPTC